MWPWNKAQPSVGVISESSPSTTSTSPSTSYTRDPSSISSRVEASIASFPESMACQQCFDLALACSNPMGQVRSGYRYGTWRGCSEEWGDFWFCMRLRMYPDAQKSAMTKEHYTEKEKKILAKPNSQDVWEERPIKAKQEEFFTGDLKDVKGW